MIWVRLIGGVKDGQVVKLDDDQPTYVAQESVPLASFRRVTLGSMTAEIKRTIYSRRVVHTPDGDITFFADENLSDHAALQSVLGP